jgi:hypothetical protein
MVVLRRRRVGLKVVVRRGVVGVEHGRVRDVVRVVERVVGVQRGVLQRVQLHLEAAGRGGPRRGDDG